MKTGNDFYKLTAVILLASSLLFSCSIKKRTHVKIEEDQLMVTRRYAGDFVEYRRTDPEDFTGYNLIWIRTTRDTIYGKISAFGKECGFSPGDRLFLRRTYFNPGGISGYWEYRIENDSTVSYRLTGFQHDRKVPVQTWFK